MCVCCVIGLSNIEVCIFFCVFYLFFFKEFSTLHFYFIRKKNQVFLFNFTFWKNLSHLEKLVAPKTFNKDLVFKKKNFYYLFIFFEGLDEGTKKKN